MSHPSPFEISDRLVQDTAVLDPIVATDVGIPGHDHEWPDLSPDGHDARADMLAGHRRALAAGVDHPERRQRLAVRVLTGWIDERLAAHEAGDHLRDLAHMASSFERIREIFDVQDRSSSRAWEAVIRRLGSVSAPLDGLWTSLRTGLQRGLVQARRQVESVISQADELAGDGSAWRRFVVESRRTAPGLTDEVEVAVGQAQAAVAVFADRLRREYLPHASADGVGRDRYLREVDRHVGLTIDADEAYAWGWQEIVRLRSALDEVGRRIDGEAVSIEEVTRLLESDPERRASTPEELVSFVGQRQQLALEGLAGSHFEVPTQIRRVTVQVAPPGAPPGAYYRAPSEDFSRPGSIWYSVGDQAVFPLYQEVSTAYHEGFPGHHLQIGTTMVHADRLSRAQRLLVWYPGHGEGWGLYAERLMDELGYLERADYVFGMLASHVFRAVRVVVDIGLHLGLRIPAGSPFHPGEPWTFDRAVDVVRRVGMQPPSYAVSEVMRYLGWPGQAISYKLGERELLALRERVRRRQGREFDLMALHDRILGDGQMRLDLLAEVVTSW